jgi:exodeoxyribonuclease VII small subunit
MKSQAHSLDFETAIAELEGIVNQMESGNLPLEKSLATYRRGAELVQTCQKALADVEQQVRILNDANKLGVFNQVNE